MCWPRTEMPGSSGERKCVRDVARLLPEWLCHYTRSVVTLFFYLWKATPPDTHWNYRHARMLGSCDFCLFVPLNTSTMKASVYLNQMPTVCWTNMIFEANLNTHSLSLSLSPPPPEINPATPTAGRELCGQNTPSPGHGEKNRGNKKSNCWLWSDVFDERKVDFSLLLTLLLLLTVFCFLWIWPTCVRSVSNRAGAVNCPDLSGNCHVRSRPSCCCCCCCFRGRLIISYTNDHTLWWWLIPRRRGLLGRSMVSSCVLVVDCGVRFLRRRPYCTLDRRRVWGWG